MINLSNFSGAPTLILIFVTNLVLTNFGFSLNISYIIFITYGAYFIFSELYSGHGLNLKNRNIFLLHLFLLLYGFIIFYLFEMRILIRENEYWWNLNSLFKFFSIIISSIVVVISPFSKIIKCILILKNISYFMIFGSLLFFIASKIGLNFLSSDEASGSRYNGGINSYILTGQFLIAGYISHIILYQKSNLIRLVSFSLFFLLAIIATKDRTSILSMCIILTLLIYRSGFGKSPFIFSIKKKYISLIIISFFSIFTIFQYQSLSSGNYEAYKSTFNRIALNVRSYELFKEVLPFGGGPGSQTYLFSKDEIKVKLNSEIYDKNSQNQGFNSSLIREISDFQAKVSQGKRLSPHNTYVDFLVPLGLIGLLYVACIFYVQIGSIKRLFFSKQSSTVFLDSFAVSSIFFFLFTSLYIYWWIYLIYFRLLLKK